MRIIFIALVFSITLYSAKAQAQVKKEVKHGNLLYNKGKFDDALKEYEKAFLKSQDSDIVNFDMGTALYKTNDYKAAMSHFERSLVTEDKSLEQKINYNIGNAKYKYGISMEQDNLDEAINSLEDSLKRYENAITLDEKDKDAKYNYEFVKKELERLLKNKDKNKKENQEENKEKKEEEKGQGQKEQEENKEKPKEAQKKEENNMEEKKLTGFKHIFFPEGGRRVSRDIATFEAFR